MYQCTGCRDIDTAVRRSLKAKRVKRSPDPNAATQVLFFECIQKEFERVAVPRDGHCMFTSFAAAWRRATKTPLSFKEVRKQVADCLRSSQGKIPGCYEQFKEDTDGTIILSDVMQRHRQSVKSEPKKAKNKDTRRTTLEDYAKQVERSLYGGDLELELLAAAFDCTIHVYSWHYFDGHRGFSPQVFGRGATTISLLFDQDFDSDSGGNDHYDCICDNFPKWRMFMLNMPKWNQDICLSTSLAGRGLKSMRDFKKGEVITFYDGHRVNAQGEVCIRRASVDELYALYGVRTSEAKF